MFCSTNIINYTFVIEILRKLYVSWSNNSERDTTRRFKLNGGKEKNKIRKKKVPLYTSVEQLEIKVLEMLRCFFQRCMVDSRMIIDAFRNVESRRRDGTTSDFQRRKRRAHTSLLSFFFFSLGRPVHYFLPQPRSRIGPMHLHKTEQVPTGPSGSDSPASMLLTCPSLPPLHGLISGRLSFFLETSR